MSLIAMETRLAIPLVLLATLAATSGYPYSHLRNMRNRRIPNPRQLYKSQDMLIRGRRGKTADDREISYLGQNPFQNNNPAPASYGYRAPQVAPLRPVDVEPNADQAFQSAAAAAGYRPPQQDTFGSSSSSGSSTGGYRPPQQDNFASSSSSGSASSSGGYRGPQQDSYTSSSSSGSSAGGYRPPQDSFASSSSSSSSAGGYRPPQDSFASSSSSGSSAGGFRAPQQDNFGSSSSSSSSAGGFRAPLPDSYSSSSSSASSAGGYRPPQADGFGSVSSSSSAQHPEPLIPIAARQQDPVPVAPQEPHAAQDSSNDSGAPDQEAAAPCDRSQCVEPSNCLNVTEGDCCPQCATYGCICEGFHQRYDCEQNGYADGKVPEGESYAVDSGSTICKCPKGGGAIVCSFGDVPFGPVSAPKILCPQTPVYCIDTFINAEGCVECRGLGCVGDDGEKHNGGSKVKKSNCQVCYCPAEGGSLLCTDDRDCIERNQGPPQTSLALEATQRVLRDPIQEEGRLPDSQYAGNQYQERPSVYGSNSNLLGYDTTLLQADWNKFGNPAGSSSSSASSSSSSGGQASAGDGVVVPPLVSPEGTGSQSPSGSNADSAEPNADGYPYSSQGKSDGFGGAGGYNGYNYGQQPYPGFSSFPGYGANGAAVSNSEDDGSQSGGTGSSSSASSSSSSGGNQGAYRGTERLPPYLGYNLQYPGYYNNLNYLGGLPAKQEGNGDAGSDKTGSQGQIGAGLNGYNVNGQYGYGYYGQGYNQFYGNQYQGGRNTYGSSAGLYPGGQGVGAGDSRYEQGDPSSDKTASIPDSTGSDLSRETRLTSVERHGAGHTGSDAGLEAKEGQEEPSDSGASSSEASEAQGTDDSAAGSETQPDKPAQPVSYPNGQPPYSNPYAYDSSLNGVNPVGADQSAGQRAGNQPSLNGEGRLQSGFTDFYSSGKRYPYPNPYMYPQQQYPQYPGGDSLRGQGVPRLSGAQQGGRYPNLAGAGVLGAQSNDELTETDKTAAGDQSSAAGDASSVPRPDLTGDDSSLGESAGDALSGSDDGQGARNADASDGGATGEKSNALPNQGLSGYPNPALGGYPNPGLNGYVNQGGFNYPLPPQNNYLNGYQPMYPNNRQPPYGAGLGIYNPAAFYPGSNALPGGAQPTENQTNFQGQDGPLVHPSMQPVLPSIVPLMSTTFLAPPLSTVHQPALPTTGYRVNRNPNATRFENVLSACCVEGKQWALEHDNCAGIRVTVDTYSQICAVAQEKCCMQAKNQEGCHLGIETARSMAACDVPSHLNGHCERDGFKPCCDCCALGLKAFGLSLSCDMQILGEPCNSAYSECCRKGRLTTDSGRDATAVGNNNNLPFVPPSPVAPTAPSSTEDTAINGHRCLVANDCEHLCHDTPDGIECGCREGYQLNEDGRTCDDINECVIGTHTCQVTQICFNTVGGFNCQRRISCGTGYELTEQNTCNDIDECDLNIHNCGSNLKCVNMRGSFRCVAKVCGTGFITDATGSCIDIDECRAGDFSCPPHSRCTNTIGSYSCQCVEGLVYSQEAQICEDLDECELGISNCQAGTTCINTNGSFTCLEPPTLSCDPGYQANEDKSDCMDVDECETGTHTCAEGSTCINLVGSFRCQDPIRCNKGTRPSPNRRSCVDINECEEGAANLCGVGGVCVNLPETYRCECLRGYRKGNSTDGPETCEDIDECALSLGRHCKYSCQNSPGSFSCVCPDGYNLSRFGRTCTDIDECHENTHNCTAAETCFNTRGGFKCVELTCPKDYATNTNRRRCTRPLCRNAPDRRKCSKLPKQVSFHNITVLDGAKKDKPLFRMSFVQSFPNDRYYFLLTKGNQDRAFRVIKKRNKKRQTGIVYTMRTMHGPKDYVVDLTLKLYRRRRWTSFVSRLYIFVSEYKF